MTAEEIIAAIAPAVPGATYVALVSADSAVTQESRPGYTASP